MGRSYHVKCLQCGNNFDVNSGGGFFFHLLHCDFCGKDKSIGFDEIGEPHLRYIKCLPGPYCVASSSLDQHIKDNYPGEPMSELSLIHISEPTRLGMISYAVFCLKKKKK